MTGTTLQGLFPLEVVAVFLCLVSFFLGFDDFRLDEGLATESATHLIARALVFADLLGNDVLSTLQGHSNVRNVAHDKALGGTLGVWLTLHQQDGGQWFKPLFTGYLCTGSALGFVGQIDIFQCGAVPTVVDALLQLGRHLILLADGLDDGLLTLGNLLQLCQTIADSRNLNLVQSPSALLAIAGDERNGTTLVEQFQRVLHTVFWQVQLCGNRRRRKYIE